MGMGKGKGCFTRHMVARRGQVLLRGAGSPSPLRNSTGLTGRRSKHCMVCTCNSATPSSSRVKCQQIQASHRPLVAPHYSRPPLLAHWNIRIHEVSQHVRFQSLVVLRCLNSSYNLKTNVFLNMATDLSLETTLQKKEIK